MPRTLLATAALLASIVFGAVACSSGSSNLAAEATSKAKKACECKTFECTTEYVKWFNQVSITRADDVDALSESDRAKYLDASLEAADCQMALG